jgi:hypothetical protein
MADLRDVQLASVAGAFLDDSDRRALTAELMA